MGSSKARQKQRRYEAAKRKQKSKMEAEVTTSQQLSSTSSEQEHISDTKLEEDQVSTLQTPSPAISLGEFEALKEDYRQRIDELNALKAEKLSSAGRGFPDVSMLSKDDKLTSFIQACLALPFPLLFSTLSQGAFHKVQVESCPTLSVSY